MEDIYRLCAPCLFGLEGLAAGELRRMGMKNVAAEDGRVLFDGGISEAATALVGLRTAERVQILAASFSASTFDELFEGTKAVEWERYIPADGAFPVRGHCVSSKLMSVPDCRSIIKKAVADRLGMKYGFTTLPEDGAKFQLRFTILRDRVHLHIDMAGNALHKRGYRALSGGAPIRETLAAGMVMLSGYRGRGAFRDPFCGSGTIAIEAALIAKNRAPSLYRTFYMEAWTGGKAAVSAAKDSAKSAEFNGDYDIMGSDIDAEMVALSRANADASGVEFVRFENADARDFAPTEPRGVAVTNPPYGERMGDEESAGEVIRGFGAAFRKLSGWEAFIISNDAELEKNFGTKADKKRKLYNGMIRCDLYSFK